MKNKKLTIIFYFIFLFTFFEAESSEQFNFDVKEIEILEKGNRYVGKNKGIGVQTLMSTTETASVATATISQTKCSMQLQTDDKEVCSVGSQWEEERSFKNAGVSTQLLVLLVN